ncbi:collagen alpha-1(III) chain-like [Spodoptera litura]|uniref:Collagen alpha-1(III) chain-like n=1 Tax=Spodoptera litura TaxID=69820 RepID=A0A9J7EHL7_SPOLT|nr:collagen alpha-1(III) chain-like [Spodoptera litura]
MGVKNPEKKVFHPPSVKREPDSPPPGYESVESNEMNKNRKPPNGLPIGRGDPKDQNIVQQMNDQDGNAIFPRPDGQPLSGSDSIDLNLLWDEFKNLVAKQRQKQKPGETMENWEEDAHMWASYSRQLVERDKTAKRRAQEEERKDAERKAARQNEHKYLNPSAGMEQYWTSNENDKKPSDPGKDMDAVGKEMLETLSRLPHSQSDSEGQGITGLDTYLSGTDKGRGPEAFPRGAGGHSDYPGNGRGPGAYSSGPGEYLRGQDTYPGGAGGFPGSPGDFPGNSGFPGSAGGYPGGAGGYPGGAGRYPGAALGYSGGSGGYPGGAGGYLGGAGGYPGGPGGYPGVAGGYPGGPGGYPGGTGGYPEGAGQFPGGSEIFSGDTRGFPGGPGGFPQGPGRFPGGAAGFPGGAGGYPGGAAGAAIPGAPEGIPGGAGGFPRNPGGFPGGPGGFPEGPGTYPRGSGSNPRSPEAFSGGLGKPGNNFKFPTELSLSKNAQLWNAMKQGIHLPMPPPKLWTRRQYDGMPPIYYKDRPNESQGAISTGRDDRYLTPEQRSQESPDYDMGPDTSQFSQSFEKPRIAFDENVNEANVPIGDGKIPGVGSEADFPNGYRPNYGDKSQISPGFYQMPQSYSSGYPEAQKNPFIKTQPKTTSNKSPPQIPLKNIVAESYPDDFKHALRMGGPRSQPGLDSESNFPEASSLDNFKHALRMGGPRFQPGPGSELNVPEGSGPDNSKHALRMGGPRFQPGPGSESDFSEGFHPKIAGGNMERGVPSSNGLHRPPRLNNQFQFQGMEQRGPPPGWHSEGKAGWKPDKSWGSSRFSPPGEPDYQPLPESERLQPNQPREFPVKGKDGPAALRDGADDVAITFQGQNSPGVDVELGQAGFKPRQPNLPTGYNLLQIALNKTVRESSADV